MWLGGAAFGLIDSLFMLGLGCLGIGYRFAFVGFDLFAFWVCCRRLEFSLLGFLFWGGLLFLWVD